MPRKRATRAPGAKSKPKQLLQGSVGEDLTEEEKQKKLDVFIQDFKIKVSEQLKKLENDLESVMTLINQKFVWEISRLPPVIRKMTLDEYIDCGGTIELAEKSMALHEECDNSLTLSAIKPQSKVSRLLPNVFETISEEDVDAPHTFTQPSTVLRRTLRPKFTPNRTMMATPATGRSTAALGWETPIITPKFDPRLPLTGAMKRAAKPGEVILSMGGSPIQNPTIRGKGNIRKRGKTLTVEVDPHCELENVVIPDNLSKLQVNQLMGVLQNFLEKAKA